MFIPKLNYIKSSKHVLLIVLQNIQEELEVNTYKKKLTNS